MVGPGADDCRKGPSSSFNIGGIVTVMHGVECALIARYLDMLPEWLSDSTIVTSFAHERVYRLCLCPTCFEPKRAKGSQTIM